MLISAVSGMIAGVLKKVFLVANPLFQLFLVGDRGEAHSSSGPLGAISLLSLITPLKADVAELVSVGLARTEQPVGSKQPEAGKVYQRGGEGSRNLRSHCKHVGVAKSSM